MLLAEVHPLLENVRHGEAVMEGLRHVHRGVGVVGAVGQVQALHQALDEVVFGEADPLVGPHAVITEVLLAVQAVRGSGVTLVARAAPRIREVLGSQKTTVMDHRRRPPVLALLFSGNHHIQQVAEEKVGGGQGVHA